MKSRTPYILIFQKSIPRGCGPLLLCETLEILSELLRFFVSLRNLEMSRGPEMTYRHMGFGNFLEFRETSLKLQWALGSKSTISRKFEGSRAKIPIKFYLYNRISVAGENIPDNSFLFIFISIYFYLSPIFTLRIKNILIFSHFISFFHFIFIASVTIFSWTANTDQCNSHAVRYDYCRELIVTRKLFQTLPLFLSVVSSFSFSF